MAGSHAAASTRAGQRPRKEAAPPQGRVGRCRRAYGCRYACTVSQAMLCRCRATAGSSPAV